MLQICDAAQNVHSAWDCGMNTCMSSDFDPDLLSEEFALRMRELLESNALSAQDLSYETRINAGVISRWLKAETLPSAKSIVVLCSYFNVSADWLLGLSTELRPARVRARTADEIVAMTDELAANPPRRRASEPPRRP